MLLSKTVLHFRAAPTDGVFIQIDTSEWEAGGTEKPSSEAL